MLFLATNKLPSAVVYGILYTLIIIRFGVKGKVELNEMNKDSSINKLLRYFNCIFVCTLNVKTNGHQDGVKSKLNL